jgi:hypothetical protein
MPPIFMTNRDVFAYEHQVGEIKWSGHNLSRLLRQTGERPERVAEMRSILGRLGIGDYTQWLCTGGVFDHGEMWGRSGKPWMIVGHPYGINEERMELLAALGRFGGLRVNVDDQTSYYGYGTNHVRIELVESRRPFSKPPATPKTRAAKREFTKALNES